MIGQDEIEFIAHGHRWARRSGVSGQGGLEDLVEVFDEAALEGSGNVFGDFFEVFFVSLGEDDGFDSCAFGGEEFFFEASDGQDEATEGDFSGHGDVISDGFFEHE